MEKKIIETVNEYVDYLETVCGNQRARLEDLKDYERVQLKHITKPSGKKYYYIQTTGAEPEADHKHRTFKYLGSDSCEEVGLIKEAHYYKQSIPFMQTNLKLCHRLLDKFRFTDYDSINEVLPKTYKNPALHMPADRIDSKAQKWKAEKEAYKASFGSWFPEDLKVTTADRKKVRSKSEALIYNEYLNQGATYVYELPIVLESGVTRHPDFTILSEVDWTTFILHDHEGMYGFEKERKRYNEDMHLYWQNGFIPGINIFYTFDDPNGGFDISVVRDIMNTKIRPGKL